MTVSLPARTRLIRPWDEAWRKKDVFPGRGVLLSRRSGGSQQAAATIARAVIHSAAAFEAGQDRADAQAMNIAPGALVIVLTIGDMRPLPPSAS